MAWLAVIRVSGICKMYSLTAGAGFCCWYMVYGTYVEVALDLLEGVGG